jgi:hypothetical protein
VAAITLVKGETAALDRTWMSMPDGSTRQVAVHVVHDLPHLVVESLFGIEDGLWGVLARGGFGAANLARTRSRGRRSRLVTDEPLDDLGARNWRGHLVAKAATNAVMNRWQEGPDTPDGVRARLRPGDEAEADYRQRIAGLLGRLDDATIALAISGTRNLSSAWARLPAGGMLRLQWPLPRGAVAGAAAGCGTPGGLSGTSTRTPIHGPTLRGAARRHAHVMNINMYVINAILILMVIRQVREHPLDLRSLAVPVLAVGCAAVLFLHSVPGGGNDIVLELSGVLVGAVMGAVGGLATRLRLGANGRPLGRAGWLAASMWVGGVGARLAFAVAASNGAGPAIARFSVAHHITGSAAWVAALIMMALADVLTRLVIIYLRGRRLAGPATTTVRTPAGIHA